MSNTATKQLGILEIEDYVNLSSARILDPVFVKTSPKRLFSLTENQRYGLVFAKNSGKGMAELRSQTYETLKAL
jgi:hypothetical protein